MIDDEELFTISGIESGIPIPPRRKANFELEMPEIPWDNMEPGDSVLIKTTWELLQKIRERVCTAKCAIKKKDGRVFVVRSEGDTIRLWRDK